MSQNKIMWKALCFSGILLLSSQAMSSGNGRHHGWGEQGGKHLKLSFGELREAWSQVIGGEYSFGGWMDYGTENDVTEDMGAYDPIFDYETFLPNSTKPRVSKIEQKLLAAYLDDSSNIYAAKLLAVHNLKKSMLYGKRMPALSLKHTIKAQYFLNRLVDLGVTGKWIELSIARGEKKLASYINENKDADLSESHHAHDYFIDAFTHNEANRYKAGDKLIRAYVHNPKNVFTSFALMGTYNWIAGEEDFSNPDVLNSIILAGYFSLRVIDLAHQAELSWSESPDDHIQFRMSNIIGGLSIISRQWLANLHEDSEAVASLNEEHRLWRLEQRAFHGFTIGLEFFGSWQTFGEGMAAWEDMFVVCDEYPTQRTCLDRPRFSFNAPTIVTGYVDFLLKANLPQVAEMLLMHASSLESFPDWDLGHDAWHHRMNNLEEIAAAYQNGDPSDDPIHLLKQRHKWGEDLPTCQLCHQSQSKVWSAEEEANVLLPLEPFASVGDWPEVTTTWYGAIVD